MTVVKTVALGVLVLAAMAPMARGAAMSYRFTTWNPERGVVFMNGSNAFGPANLPITWPLPAAAESIQTWQGSGTFTTVYSAPPPPPPPPAPTARADAFLNMANGGYDEAGSLVSGQPKAWFNSPVVQNLYGHLPTSQEQASFTNQVLQRVEQTYQLAGVPLVLTADPHVQVAHMLSVVSGAGYAGNPNAIGITDMGNSGFSFIDKFGFATTVDQLEWVVAHNVSHELMHAFGVDHHDKTATYLDAPSASWNQLSDPNFTFGSAAAQDLLSRNFRAGGDLMGFTLGPEVLRKKGGDYQTLTPQAVPEPTTLALWGLASSAVAIRVRRSRRRAA